MAKTRSHFFRVPFPSAMAPRKDGDRHDLLARSGPGEPVSWLRWSRGSRRYSPAAVRRRVRKYSGEVGLIRDCPIVQFHWQQIRKDGFGVARHLQQFGDCQRFDAGLGQVQLTAILIFVDPLLDSECSDFHYLASLQIQLAGLGSVLQPGTMVCGVGAVGAAPVGAESL